MQISTNVVGLDIGYGNLKAVGGNAHGAQRREVVLPAGAAPIDALPRLHDRADLKGGELVLLHGAEWVAGVEQVHLQNSVRKTHENYSSEPEYEALFLGGLARLGYDHVHLLVTGLPVSQYYGPNADVLKGGLQRLMQGRKHVSAGLTVTVDRVLVLPQPFGTYMALVSDPVHADLAEREDTCGMVCDPGYFSFDWVLLDGQSVKHQFSGSSQMATSRILEKAALKISERLGAKVNGDRLDMALRRGYDVLNVGGTDVDYKTVLSEVANDVGAQVAAQMLSTTRNYDSGIDYIVLTGGGAWLYEQALAKAFPKVKIRKPGDSVLANAQGYFAFGAALQTQAAKSARSAA